MSQAQVQERFYYLEIVSICAYRVIGQIWILCASLILFILIECHSLELQLVHIPVVSQRFSIMPNWQKMEGIQNSRRTSSGKSND